MSYTLELLEHGCTHCICLNDIHDVIRGKKPEQPFSIDTSSYLFGLGNGSLDTIQSLGEAIIVDGMAYVKTTDKTKDNYYTMLHAQQFVTSWALMLSRHSRPHYRVTGCFEQSLKLIDLYHDLDARIQQPFLIAGQIHGAVLYETAIARAPIDGLSIFEHELLYYPKQMKSEHTHAIMVGVVANMSKLQGELAEKMNKIVYYNPLEGEKDTLTTHEHVLILNRDTAVDALHLYTSSMLLDFHLDIYCLDDIEMRISP